MNCIEFLAEQSRCRQGIPIARLFGYYFCKGNHKRCPLKNKEKMEERCAVSWPNNLFEREPY